MSNKFHVLFKQRDFTRKNFQTHTHPEHHENYMAGSVRKHTSRKCWRHIRQSQAKHVNTKTKTVWIRKNDLRWYVAHTALKTHNSNMWYLDSGCSRHMCGNKIFFNTVTKCDRGLITFDDDNTFRVVEKCKIRSQGLPNLNVV